MNKFYFGTIVLRETLGETKVLAVKIKSPIRDFEKKIE